MAAYPRRHAAWSWCTRAQWRRHPPTRRPRRKAKQRRRLLGLANGCQRGDWPVWPLRQRPARRPKAGGRGAGAAGPGWGGLLRSASALAPRPGADDTHGADAPRRRTSRRGRPALASGSRRSRGASGKKSRVGPCWPPRSRPRSVPMRRCWRRIRSNLPRWTPGCVGARPPPPAALGGSSSRNGSRPERC